MEYEIREVDIGIFNPFHENSSNSANIQSFVDAPTFVPATHNLTQSTISATPILSSLEDREKKLRDLEDDINKRENLLNNEINSFGVNNFPPFPNWCPIRPCFYQDIDLEITTGYRPLVRLAYRVWLLYAGALLLNVVGTLSYMIVNNANELSAITFGVSLLLLVLLVPLSYLLCFRVLYKAFRSFSSGSFFAFFFFYGVLCLLIFFQCLGINRLGSCGWINTLGNFSVNIGSSVVMLIVAVAFTVILFMSLFIYIKVHRIYRTTGPSRKRAPSSMPIEPTFDHNR